MASENPLTIDNLGIGASERYAWDQEILDPNLIKDSRWLSARTELSVIQPYAALADFSVGDLVLWASFSAPPNYQTELTGLFTHQLIPAIGDAMKIQALLDQVSGMIPATVAQPEQQRAFRTILDLLTQLEKLTRMFAFIKANSSRYQQG